MVLTLLDTRLRATDICSLTVKNVDLISEKVTVRYGVEGGVKDGKGRTFNHGRFPEKLFGDTWQAVKMGTKNMLPSSSAMPKRLTLFKQSLPGQPYTSKWNLPAGLRSGRHCSAADHAGGKDGL